MAEPVEPGGPISVGVYELVPVDVAHTVIEGGGNATLIPCRYRGRDWLFKKFRPEHLAEVDESALLELVGWRLELPSATRDRLDELASWPRYVVRDGSRVYGVLIPIAADRFFRLTPTGVRTPRSFYDLLPSRQYIGPPLAEKLTASACAVRAVLWLHDLDLLVDDLQPDNMLCATAGTAVYLVDCDSMVLPGRWGRVARPAAPDIMTAVVAPDAGPDRVTDLTKLTWIVLRTQLDDFSLVRLGGRERARLAELVSPEPAAFLLGALDRMPGPDAWRELADSWHGPARVRVGTPDEARVRRRPVLVAADAGYVWPARTRAPRSGRWPGDRWYRPEPARPLFPERYARTARRSTHRSRIWLLIGAVALLATVAGVLTAHFAMPDGRFWP
jgi:hypothetical protein